MKLNDKMKKKIYLFKIKYCQISLLFKKYAQSFVYALNTTDIRINKTKQFQNKKLCKLIT